MFDLNDRVSIVTGGNGGLGLAFARGLVKCGGSVAIWGRNEEKNAAALAELKALSNDVDAFVCDVTDEASIQSAFEQTLARFGHVDICFANAGGGGFRGLSHATSRNDWLETIDLNLMSVVHTWSPVTEYLLQRQKGGKLIVTSSVAALVGDWWRCWLFNYQGSGAGTGSGAGHRTRPGRNSGKCYSSGLC